MKANELMIGDKVSVQMEEGYFHCEVEYIGKSGDVCVRNDEISCGGLDSGYECNANDLWPIPLTPEILEVNGFEYTKDDGQFYRSLLGNIEKDDYVAIGWRTDGKPYSFEVATPKKHNGPHSWEGGRVCYGYDAIYVHELQHALRLCGLNELADNFKA